MAVLKFTNACQLSQPADRLSRFMNINEPGTRRANNIIRILLISSGRMRRSEGAEVNFDTVVCGFFFATETVKRSTEIS